MTKETPIKVESYYSQKELDELETQSEKNNLTVSNFQRSAALFVTSMLIDDKTNLIAIEKANKLIDDVNLKKKREKLC